jgi:uncharacterized protein YbjT (DUF2867 family)
MSDDAKKRVIVAGSTGLVGAALTRLLAARRDVEVWALVRSAKPGRFPETVHEEVFDFDADTSYASLAELRPDVLFCCLGTTRAKAGSDEAFRKVDRDYPVRLCDAMASLEPKPVFALVSSVGADSARGLYLRTKSEVEEHVRDSGLPFVVVRPSFLLGERQEHRLGEKIGIATLGPVLRGLGAAFSGLRRYSPIHADDVARALAHLALDREKGPHVAEGALLFEAASR